VDSDDEEISDVDQSDSDNVHPDESNQRYGETQTDGVGSHHDAQDKEGPNSALSQNTMDHLFESLLEVNPAERSLHPTSAEQAKEAHKKNFTCQCHNHHASYIHILQ